MNGILVIGAEFEQYFQIEHTEQHGQQSQQIGGAR